MSTHNEICYYLQTTPVVRYNSNIKKFISFLDPGFNSDSYVSCYVLEDRQSKPNLCITIDDYDYYISVLSGQGNSVHEENPSDFIDFLENLGANQDILNFINELCHYRNHTTAFMNTQSSVRISTVRQFFESVRYYIIERALKYGQYDFQETQYIYWGDPSYGKYCTIDEAIDKLQSYRASTSLIPIGGLVLQRKDYRVNNNIQLKWSNPAGDI